jgi:hypothetical protein
MEYIIIAILSFIALAIIIATSSNGNFETITGPWSSFILRSLYNHGLSVWSSLSLENPDKIKPTINTTYMILMSVFGQAVFYPLRLAKCPRFLDGPVCKSNITIIEIAQLIFTIIGFLIPYFSPVYIVFVAIATTLIYPFLPVLNRLPEGHCNATELRRSYYSKVAFVNAILHWIMLVPALFTAFDWDSFTVVTKAFLVDYLMVLLEFVVTIFKTFSTQDAVKLLVLMPFIGSASTQSLVYYLEL